VFSLQMPFHDFLSLILFLIGCLLSLFAFYKGYTIDDPYPEHGDYDRRHRAAEKAYEAEVAQVRQECGKVLTEHRGGLMSAQQSLSSEGARITQLHAQIEAAVRTRQATITEIESDHRLVLEHYRNTNRTVRSIAVPNYFNTLISPTGGLRDTAAQAPRDALGSLAELFKRLRASFLDLLTQKIQRVIQEEGEMLGETFNKFLEEVRLEAEKRIVERRATIKTNLATTGHVDPA